MISPLRSPSRPAFPSPTPFAWLVAGLLLTLCPWARAEQPTLSGRWQASAMRSVWNVGDWGEACGPRPQGGGAGAGTVTITQQGSELMIAEPARSYSTTQCWEQFPGMTIAGHSGGSRGWRTTCRTAAGDPRQATITTNITATDSYINFDEAGQYQFVIKKQNCTASVRRSRTFKLLQRAGEPPAADPPPPPSPPPAPPPVAPPTEVESTPPPTTACTTQGPPVRLEVRPAEKLIRQGESFRFRATVLDESGCRLALAPVWSVSGAGPVKLIGPGHVRVADDAPEGVVLLTASVGGKSVEVRLQVVSEKRYDELLETAVFDERGESQEAAVAVIASGGIGASRAVTEDQGRQRRLVFLVVLGGLAGVLALVGLLLARSTRRQPARATPLATPMPTPAPTGSMRCPTCGQDYPLDRSFCPNDGNRLIAAEPELEVPQGGVCPICGQGYDPGVERCREHGEVLVPVAVYQTSRAHAPVATLRICPICGTQYPGDALFCGRDGGQLVQVN